ncbi:hypothetical protein QZM93_38275 [Burkholderia cepacia]|uniref:hypothetical protein n=1 Tax=Burkholderia cepacia TaxID=292 RepID=UPI002650077C|nr:hypothetical protein [Burkholderia cepacia]MDN7894450.1 hypothetical protein [Burkholderia cepacia]
MIALGIDPGIRGALAALDHNGRLRIADMPIREKQGTGKTRNEIDPPALLRMVRDLVPAGDTAIVVMEDMHAFMGGGEERRGSMASQASLAATKAVVCAVLEIAGHPTQFVTPQRWKRFYGLGADKAQCLDAARRLYPHAPLTRAKDHNRAESVLIARWALRNLV